MLPFLKLVADDLLKDYGTEISNLTLVFPNRRASLFFNKYLSESIEKPIWQPNVTTITDIMYDVSGLRQVDNISLIVRLYNIYTKQLHSVETFDNFYFWGEVMLADFDQIDKYGVDAGKLFTNIFDIKEIDERFGGFTPHQLEALKAYLGVMSDSTESVIRDRYLSIWKVLGSIYSDFRSSLINDGYCYEGLAYSYASSKLKGGSEDYLSGKYVFIGFNALNDCEKTLFRYLKKSDQAIFYWDYDVSYINSEVHEAAMFLRDNIYEFPNKLHSNHFMNFGDDSKIYLISSPSGVAQTKLLPQIINQLKGNKLDINTAIILPEEHLLTPVLSALPDDIGEFNITMGYPLKETSAYSLAELILRLHINSRSEDGEGVKFYHKDVLSLLNHPYLQMVDAISCAEIIKTINTKNIIFISSSELAISEIFKEIFVKLQSGIEIAKYLVRIITRIASNIDKQETESGFSTKIELEYLYTLFTNLNRLVDVVEKNSVELSIKIYRQLFRKALSQIRVSFNGEPLSGIQVMGFLETRLLDFENIIMLSVNDDVLPGNHHRPSFITPSLRYAYGLPDYSHQDAIYAYYFYRLLQRSSNVYFVYRNRAEGLVSGELSRFVLQLLMESGKKIDRIDVKFDLGIASQSPILIDKQGNVLEKLNRYLVGNQSEKFISPSAFTSYLTCPLQFYFRYVADIREPDEVLEEVDLPGFGKILHAAMEAVYSRFGDKVINASDIENLLKHPKEIEEIIDKAYAKVYFKTEKQDIRSLLAGRNLLVLDQIKYSINLILKTDIRRTPFKIIKQEEKVRTALDFGEGKTLRIGGYVDRLEEASGKVKVVDYKTGNPYKKGIFSNLDDLFTSKAIDKSKEVLQLFTYCYALKCQEGYADIKPELWFVRNVSPDYLPNIIYKDPIAKIASEVESFNRWEGQFIEKLCGLVAEIYDESKPFCQTTDENACKNCPYNLICVRS